MDGDFSLGAFAGLLPAVAGSSVLLAQASSHMRENRSMLSTMTRTTIPAIIKSAWRHAPSAPSVRPARRQATGTAGGPRKTLSGTVVLGAIASAMLLATQPALAAPDPGTESASDAQRIALRTKPAVVRIYDGCDGAIRFAGSGKTYNVWSYGYGAGFFINPEGYLVTNAHVAARTKDGPDACKQHLNRSQGGICMGGWLEDRLNSGGEHIGLGLEDGSAAAFDLISPIGQTAEERADFLADLGCGA